MNIVKAAWVRAVPYPVRRRISDIRYRGETIESLILRNAKLREDIRELKMEIDELRVDQRRVAELMDTVEQLSLDLRQRSGE